MQRMFRQMNLGGGGRKGMLPPMGRRFP
jgi:hypothetical protein